VKRVKKKEKTSLGGCGVWKFRKKKKGYSNLENAKTSEGEGVVPTDRERSYLGKKRKKNGEGKGQSTRRNRKERMQNG